LDLQDWFSNLIASENPGYLKTRDILQVVRSYYSLRSSK